MTDPDKPEEIKASRNQNRLCSIFLVAIQVLFIMILWIIPTKRTKDMLNAHAISKRSTNTELEQFRLENVYGVFQDVQIMIFVGFGFLMCFLKRFSWSSAGFTMLIAVVSVQWSLILHTCFFHKGEYLVLNYEHLYEAEFGAATVLISFGALLGKVSHFQMLVMAIIEITFFKLNQWLVLEVIHFENTVFFDIGGSIIVHIFGAYFGLAVTRVIYKDCHDTHEDNSENIYSDLFAMVGTVFLWIMWPSFNGAPSTSAEEMEIVVGNTYLSLVAATVMVFALSGLTDKSHRFCYEHIQNATLAGGVAMGSAANIPISAGAALLTGAVGGTVSVLGFQYLSPFLNKWIKLNDTCGVHNLHGMPGILGGIFAIIYGAAYNAPGFNLAYEFEALFLTLAMSLVGGALTGFVVKFAGGKQEEVELFQDKEFWTHKHD